MFTIHELLKYLFAMNYEKKKKFVCNTCIMKIFVCIELWKQINVFCNTDYENVYLQYMNYENIHLKHMNYEKLKYLLSIHELWKYLFKIHELWKMKLFAMHELWKYFFAINEL